MPELQIYEFPLLFDTYSRVFILLHSPWPFSGTLMSMRIFVGSSEPLLYDNPTSIVISCAGS